MIHENSILSWATFPDAGRCKAVRSIMKGIGRPATDREIATQAGQADMNWARPSITRLIDSGHLAEYGSKVCSVTGRTVRLVYFAPALINQQPSLF